MPDAGRKGRLHPVVTRGAPLWAVCATAFEARQVRCGLAAAGPGRWRVVATGMGSRQAGVRLGRALARAQTAPAGLLLVGLAGSRDAALPRGSWAWAAEVRGAGGPAARRPDWAMEAVLPPGWAGACRTAAYETVSGVLDVAAAAPAGPPVVEMETLAWSQAAAAARVPWAAVRLVSDDPCAPLPAAMVAWFAGRRRQAARLALARPGELAAFVGQLRALGGELRARATELALHHAKLG